MLPKRHVLPSFIPLTSAVIWHTTLGLPTVQLVPSLTSFSLLTHFTYIFFWFQLQFLPGLFRYKSLDCQSLLANFQFMARCSIQMFLSVMNNATSPSCLQWRKKRHYLCHRNSSFSLLWRAGCSFRWVSTEQRFHSPRLLNLLYLQSLTRLLQPLSRCVNASVFWTSLSFLNITSNVSHLCRFILINDHWCKFGVFLPVWFSLNLS